MGTRHWCIACFVRKKSHSGLDTSKLVGVLVCVVPVGEERPSRRFPVRDSTAEKTPALLASRPLSPRNNNGGGVVCFVAITKTGHKGRYLIVEGTCKKKTECRVLDTVKHIAKAGPHTTIHVAVVTKLENAPVLRKISWCSYSLRVCRILAFVQEALGVLLLCEAK